MSETVASPTPRRTALVTGPTAGIGHAFARQLAQRGHDLVLVARDEARLAEVAADLRASYGVEVEVLPADLADRAQLLRVEARLADRDRPVDLLVNNAGFGLKGRFLDNDIGAETGMLDVLVTAVLRLSHAALGPMSERGRGGIINVSSVAAFLPRGTYSAAKAWVNSFSEWAANEYRDRGVHVMALCPGFTKTEFHARMDVGRGSAPGFLWLDADELVTAALADFDRRRVLSIPSLQYKVISGLARGGAEPGPAALPGPGPQVAALPLAGPPPKDTTPTERSRYTASSLGGTRPPKDTTTEGHDPHRTVSIHRLVPRRHSTTEGHDPRRTRPPKDTTPTSLVE